MKTINQTNSQKETATMNNLTQFDVFTYPAFFHGSQVDHTYINFGNGEKLFPCGGGSSGGTKLKDASGEENLDLANAFNDKMSIPFTVHIPYLWRQNCFSY